MREITLTNCRGRRSLRRLMSLMVIFIMLISVFADVSANSMMRPRHYAEFINTKDYSKYYVLLLSKKPDSKFKQVLISSKNESLGDAYMLYNSEYDIPNYISDGVDTFLKDFDGLDGFTYEENMCGLQCCWGDSIITYNDHLTSDEVLARYLIYWPDSGEYKLSETFSFSNTARTRVDMSEESEYFTVTNLAYAYDLNAVLPGIAFHLAATLIIEVLIAIFFKFRSKKQLATIIVTNVITNITVNIVAVLSLKNYISFYVLIELAVLVVEFIVYRLVMSKEVKTGRILLFTAAANLFSAIGGFFAFMAVLIYTGIS